MTAFIAVAILLALATAALVGGSLARAPRGVRASSDDLNAAVYRDQLAELDVALADGTLSPERHAGAREAVRLRLAQELRGAAGVAARMGPSRGAALGSALLLVAGAGILYAILGTPAALDPAARVVARDDSAHGLQGEQIAGMVERLAARLRDNPEDLNGWVMLARSYGAIGRFNEASRAYGEAVRLAPNDAPLLADYADALAMAQGRRFDGEPDRMVARALRADGSNIKALALAGSSAFARQDFHRAIEHWSRIRDQVAADSDMARSIDASIAQARAAAGGVSSVGSAAPAQAAAVSGTVDLSPALAARVNAGDTLFIYARPVDGSRMPLAIDRRAVGTWPASFRLDDASAMSPAARLSTQSRVVLEARISKSGSANPTPGDLRGVSPPVEVGREGIVIEIASVIE